MIDKRSAALPGLYMVASSGVGSVLTAFLYVLVARSLQPASYGRLSSLLGVSAILVDASVFGAAQELVRLLRSASPLSGVPAKSDLVTSRLVLAALLAAGWGLGCALIPATTWHMDVLLGLLIPGGAVSTMLASTL